MKILGIETSCDETAAAVVLDGELILSNVVSSSLKDHARYGGVIPEIASRRQMEYIKGVVEESLVKAKTEFSDIDAVAVTIKPGLIGSLLVGTSFAQALAFAIKRPLIEVNHIEAHMYANFLRFAENENFVRPKLPAIGLVVSGGHSSLYEVKNFKSFQVIGQTRDDAVGESFDKVARILGLGYPGGPIIDRLAQKGASSSVRFNCANLENSYDFSFSGIKTAVLYHHRDHANRPDFKIEDVAYAFQESVTKVLIQKSINACRKKKIKTLLVGGGVAANSFLRTNLMAEASREGINVFFPPMSLCLDNAAMIAGLGFHLRKGKLSLS